MKSERYVAEGATGKARWMVVDDTDSVRDLIELLLRHLGCAEICCFRSGAEALAEFTAAPGKYQFVVTDFEMSGMDGMELCRKLLSIDPNLKVLLATGSSAVAPDYARQAGFCGLLDKPFPPARLTQIMEAAGVIRPAPAEEKDFSTVSAALTLA